MGLIKAALGAVGGTFADQWKEYFYCEAMDSEILVQKGQKRVSGRSSNRHGDSNVITDGSGIAVADGQCMMIVENGKVAEVCAEPGEYTYDSSLEPSIFGGSLGEGIRRTFAEIGRRFTYGGAAGKDQRVYYFNTKEIMGNKYGTPTPVPFRVIDRNIGLDVDISIRCNGEYSYRIADPILFYTNVCGNVAQFFERSEMDSMLKSELLTALQPAFAKISEMGVRYSALPGHTMELADALNDVLSKKWKELRGIVIASFGVNSVSASKEDEDMIKQMQKSAILRDPTMAAATLVGAQGDAMRTAAGNQAGAMTGFMGMGMAGAAGGMNAQDLYAMGQNRANTAAQGNQASQAGAGTGVPGKASETGSWTCGCGTENTGKFCRECGAKRPETSWRCSCGAENTGKFCQECGAKKPEGSWLCTCGTMNDGKFCRECGAKRP
ncbi:MAG: SPFH domain-containing protein [Lachnospiraceae bacterium]|jgi:membrane protease subunit (stomatin/prohibitin family)|nr:SPFH domain-containing protein [Lachnospiraceae bacterium]